jgi:hypothetical protein
VRPPRKIGGMQHFVIRHLLAVSSSQYQSRAAWTVDNAIRTRGIPVDRRAGVARSSQRQIHRLETVRPSHVERAC